MNPDTRSSRPRNDPDNGLSRWDNEGGAPSNGDRSRMPASKAKKPGRPAKDVIRHPPTPGKNLPLPSDLVHRRKRGIDKVQG